MRKKPTNNKKSQKKKRIKYKNSSHSYRKESKSIREENSEIVELIQLESNRHIGKSKNKEIEEKKSNKDKKKIAEIENIIICLDMEPEKVINLSESESNSIDSNDNSKISSKKKKKEKFIGINEKFREICNNFSPSLKMKKKSKCPEFLSSKKIYEDLNDDESNNGIRGKIENDKVYLSESNYFLNKKRNNDKINKIEEKFDESCEKIKKYKFEQKNSSKFFSSENVDKEKDSRSKSCDKICKKSRKEQKYVSPELGIFYYLIGEYGIDKVVDSIYKSDNPPRNKLDICLKGIKEMYGENKLIMMIIKSMISSMKEKINGIFPSKKRTSSSHSKKTDYHNENYKKKIEDIYSEEISNLNIPVIFLNDDDEEEENNNKDKKIINSIKDLEKNKDEKEERRIAIETHYNKGKGGNVYKYAINCLLGKIVVFHCFDKGCNSVGTLDLETKKFRIQEEHNLKHCEHNYVINFNKEKDDEIFQEILDKNYLDAQIFREGKNMIVRYYE
jgi:hypothetical protein